MSRPAIFVPYPRRGQNDQTANAYLMEQQGAARVVEQGEGFTDRLWTAIAGAFQPSELLKMSSNISQLPKTNALASIVDRIEGRI